jgi:hypothetical protein
VNNLVVVRDDTILAHNILLDAGKGGDATTGKGGNGGNIKKVTGLAIDVATFSIDSGVQGDGGSSVTGKGGNGGTVTSINLTDTDSGVGLSATMNIRSGRGGDGATGGGKGGGVSTLNLTTQDANIVINASSGGNATANGRGGVGGGVSKAQLTGDGLVGGFDVSGFIQTGTGGNGIAKNGTGGAGGSIKLVNMNVHGDGSLVAGNGGNGQVASGNLGAAPGKGGSIVTSGVFATGSIDPNTFLPIDGAGLLHAGSAGTDGAKPAAGGSILGNATGIVTGGNIAGLRALTDLTIEAGNGSHGGAGGSIRGIAYGSTAASLTPTPSGNILIQAGNGSGEGKFAGKGGSLVSVFGSTGSGASTTTTLNAGIGGSAASKAADGGSISNIELSLGGGPGVLLTLQAGDGGTTTSGKSGGRGGSVSKVGITNLDPGTNLRSIAAGDGGGAVKQGGNGGSISTIDVQAHDIGVRTGEMFGFTTMGGLFAGVGGVATAGKNGANGSVSHITADSIAAIVAGRTQIPQLARKVSDIILNDDNLLLVRNHALNPDGSYDPNYYAIANLVGAIFDITRPEAFKFAYVDNNANNTFEPGDTPIDGIVMAESFDQSSINFIPEARFTTIAPAGSTAGFFDNDDLI